MISERLKSAIPLSIGLLLILGLDFLYFRSQNTPPISSEIVQETQPGSEDEVDLDWISKQNQKAHAVIYFQQKSFHYYGTTENPNGFAGLPQSTLSDTQIVQIKKHLLLLPATESRFYWNDADYKKEYHVAFYSQSNLVKLHYPKDNLPASFSELLRFLNLEDFYK